MGVFGHDIISMGTSTISKDFYSTHNKGNTYNNKSINYLGDDSQDNGNVPDKQKFITDDLEKDDEV